MENKVILLSRVSTQKQTLEQQTNELKLESEKLGYKTTNTIIIEDKESAIALDEQERHGLNQLKDYINNDDTIDCVICYEISRISRRPKVLYSIRDFLIAHNTQLIILKPYMKLLDNDGKMSQTASIMFSLFSSLSESEMMLKKERMKRGKLQKMHDNKWVGGHVTFGYKVDENKNIVVDEHNAEIVKKIFIEYSKGTSVRKLAIDLMEEGDIKRDKLDNANAFVNQTLLRKQYYGDCSKVGYNYTPIITKELFDKCRKVAKQNIRRPKTLISMVYWCRNLLYNATNNRMLTPCKANRVYSMHNLSDNTTLYIRINILDSFVWHIVKEKVTFDAPADNEQNKIEISNQITTLKKKIKTARNKKDELYKQIDRIDERIIKGKMEEFRGDKMISEVKSNIVELDKKINEWMNEETNKQTVLSELKTGIPSLNDLNVLTDEDIKKLINKYISKIMIWKKDHAYYDIDVIWTTGMINSYSLKSGSRYPKFYNEYGEQMDIEFLKRILCHVSRQCLVCISLKCLCHIT